MTALNKIIKSVCSLALTATMLMPVIGSSIPIVSAASQTVSTSAAQVNVKMSPNTTVTCCAPDPDDPYNGSKGTIVISITSSQEIELRLTSSNSARAGFYKICCNGVQLDNNGWEKFVVKPGKTYTAYLYFAQCGSVDVAAINGNNTKVAECKNLTAEQFYVMNNANTDKMKRFRQDVINEYNKLPVQWREFLEEYDVDFIIYDKFSLEPYNNANDAVYGSASVDHIKISTGQSASYSVIHESAHQIQRFLADVNVHNKIQNLFNQHGYRFMYPHAYSNSLEFFAESVNYYFHNPQLLSAYEPEMYTFIDDLMKNPGKYLAKSQNLFKVTQNSSIYQVDQLSTKTFYVNDWIKISYNTNTSFYMEPKFSKLHDVYFEILNEKGNSLYYGKTPYQFKQEGTYTLVVHHKYKGYVQNQYSGHEYNTYRFKIKVKGLLENQSKFTNKSTTMIEGQTKEIKCLYNNNTGVVKNKIYVKVNNSKYQTSRDWSTNQNYQFTPKTPGTYSILIKMNDDKGIIAEKTLMITVNEKLENLSKFAISATTMQKGDTREIQCLYKYNNGVVKNKIYAQVNNGTYKMLRDWSTSQTYKFTPDATGKYNILIKMNDNNNIIAEKTLTINSVDFQNTSSIKTSTICQNTNVNLSLQTKNNVGSVTYKVSLKAPNQTSFTAYQTTTSSTMSIKLSQAGKHQISVVAIDQKTQQKNEKIFDVQVLKFENQSTINKTTVKYGEKITITPKAGNASGNVKTTIKMLPPNSNQYITLKNDEVVQSFQYSILVRGQYVFKVIVKDNAGNSMEKELKVNGTFLQNTSKPTQTSGYANDVISVKLQCLNGSGTAKYSVYLKSPSAKKERTICDNISSNQAGFKAEELGTYHVRVVVTDDTKYRDQKDFDINILPMINTSTINTTNTGVGCVIRVTPSVKGNIGAVKYSVVASLDNKEQINIEKTNSYYGFQANKAGTYAIRVIATDSQGQQKFKDFTVKVQEIQNNCSLSSSATKVNKTITINTPHQYGVGIVKVTIKVQKDNGSFTYLHQDKVLESTTYTPKQKGNYKFVVAMKDAFGNTSKVKTLTLQVT